jgi:hypothetical protein
VRVAVEDGEIITVAIRNQLEPGPMEVPPTWTFQIAAAFMPDVQYQDLAFPGEIAGRPIDPAKEIVYCNLLEEE